MAGLTLREGRVSRDSRLYRSLTEPHRSQAMGLGEKPDLSLHRLNGSHPVFLLHDHDGGEHFVLKSFAEKRMSASSQLRSLDREYDRLKYLARIRAGGERARCVKPVCRDRQALYFVEEAVSGHDLGYYAARSLRKGAGTLRTRLKALAGFFHELHGATRTEKGSSARSVEAELLKHAAQAYRKGALGEATLREAGHLIHRWCRALRLSGVPRSLVHGDATVSNFLFRDGHLFAIDLERSRYTDPAYDLGMLAGELFNEALLASGDPYEADPYIGHLYQAYARRSADPGRTFEGLVARNPLYMANSLLRMARNGYYTPEHRQRLAFYGLECLRSRPRR